MTEPRITDRPADPLARLGAANPAGVDPSRAHSPVAQAALQRILADPASEPDAAPSALARLRGRVAGSTRGLAVAGAVVVLGTGGALAATDPMHWWSSAPNQANYQVAPNIRVATPTADTIRCRPASDSYRCVRTRAGDEVQTYQRDGTVPRALTEAQVARMFAGAKAGAGTGNGGMPAAVAARLRADLAAVPRSFFSTYALLSHYRSFAAGTPGRSGKSYLPPASTPDILVCRNANGGQLSCQVLNGDTNAPVGAGIYTANQTRHWRRVRVITQVPGLPPGIHFTPAEVRVLGDLARYGAQAGHPTTHIHQIPKPKG